MLSVLFALLAAGALVVGTSHFVRGAARVAEGMGVSPVIIGAVVLGCGIGLPELALAFERHPGNPWEQLFGVSTGSGLGVRITVLALVIVLAIPTLFPSRMKRHSPVILAATIMFAALLRGSLDTFEGTAMMVGFIFGVAAVLHANRPASDDPFAPLVEDTAISRHGTYVDTPVMTTTQLGFTRCLIGLVVTVVSAQVLARSVQTVLTDAGAQAPVINVTYVILGSVLPHVVVAVQALAQHHEGLAAGNLIGSNLFQSLAIGGLVSIIRPYQLGGTVGADLLIVTVATGVITFLLLHNDSELSRRQGVGLLSAYVALVACTVA